VGRRFGVRIAGVVAGLPAIGGPILLVVTIDEGHRFAAQAAVGTMLGVVGVALYVVVYAALARFGWPVALAGGWAAFGASIPLLRVVHVSAPVAFAIATSACVAAAAILPRHPPSGLTQLPPRFDLPFRAVAAVVPILVVTAAARTLGPHVTGVLATFPVISPVLTVFTHAQRGAQEAVRLLRGFVIGFLSYGLFAFVVAMTIARTTTAASFAAALAAALAAQVVLVLLSLRQSTALSRSA
jgi:hypothetical protein